MSGQLHAPVALTHRGKSPSTNAVKGCVGFRAGQDVLKWLKPYIYIYRERERERRDTTTTAFIRDKFWDKCRNKRLHYKSDSENVWNKFFSGISMCSSDDQVQWGRGKTVIPSNKQPLYSTSTVFTIYMPH
jgi:hypothetical protein